MRDRSKLIKELDGVFSNYIRTRDHWTCVRCGTRHVPPTRNLQCSHFWVRVNMGTRWDDKNCDALCGTVIHIGYGRTKMVSCHGTWEDNRQGDYRDFKIKQLGQQEYDLLEYRARSVTKYSIGDLQTLLDYWKKRLKNLKE